MFNINMFETFHAQKELGEDIDTPIIHASFIRGAKNLGFQVFPGRLKWSGDTFEGIDCLGAVRGEVRRSADGRVLSAITTARMACREGDLAIAFFWNTLIRRTICKHGFLKVLLENCCVWMTTDCRRRGIFSMRFSTPLCWRSLRFGKSRFRTATLIL